jgi:hypothetical protein
MFFKWFEGCDEEFKTGLMKDPLRNKTVYRKDLKEQSFLEQNPF